MTACLCEQIKKIIFQKQQIFPLLEDISFEVQEGEVYMITGPSRCGKSTLLRIIGGLLKPTSGTVSVFGLNLFDMNERSASDFRLRNIGYVFETSSLIDSLSLFDNIAVPMRLVGISSPLIETRVLEILGQIGMVDQKNQYPTQISEGEKSLICIARALVLLPKLLILDEPTLHLDHPTGVKIFTHIRELAYDHQITIISATTDIRLHPFADRVAKMKEGKISMVAGEPSTKENELPFLKL